MRISPRTELDNALARLADRKQAWVTTPVPERIALIERCMDRVVGVAERLRGPVITLRNLRLLRDALRQGGHPPPGRLRKHASGSIVAEGLIGGGDAEVWIEPGKPASQGAIYRNEKGAGRVCLVAGADEALSTLFVDDQVALVNVHDDSLGEVMLEAFAPLVEQGFLGVVHGDDEAAAYLAELVDTVHPAERCVTPVLVVPGPWSRQDIDFQARNVAAMVTHDAGFNPSAARVLVVSEEWLQRETFLTAVEQALAACPPHHSRDPMAFERYRAFLDEYPQADPVGEQGDGIVPWTLIRHVSARRGERALTEAAFCEVLAVVSMVTSGPQEFLQRAVSFVNDDCSGTLSAAMLVHPATVDAYPEQIESAIAALRYGTLALNAWPGVGHALASTRWGPFGGGFIHNAQMFDHAQKAVVRAPFRPLVKPSYFPGRGRLGPALLAYERSPSWRTKLDVMLSRVRP